MPTRSGSPDPFIFVPKEGSPQLLFVLLHGEAAGPEQMFALADAIKHAFPQAVVFIPYAFENLQASNTAETTGLSGYHWINPDQLNEGNRASRIEQALPVLIKHVQQLQTKFGLTGQQTAMAGFSQGASMALEASDAKPDLAGRILAFSGLYATPPTRVESTTMLHFFHGANDQQVSVEEVEATLVRLSELQGDATLDVASRIGHELHRALIDQAIVRLQTCVPLRNWEDAMASFGNDKTLH